MDNYGFQSICDILICIIFLLDGATYDTRYIGSAVHSSNAHLQKNMIHENVVVKSVTQDPALDAAVSPSMKMSVEQNTSYAPEQVGDKKLRNLLQKTNSEALLIPSNSEIFLPNDVMRLGLMQNPALNQSNPMLSMSGNIQHMEMKNVDQDGKNQLDIKISESQEVMSSTAVELENVGFGDILGGFGEGDDDDLLKSLTSEIGDDFNILEYADPELDVNVLNTLDFDDNEKNST